MKLIACIGTILLLHFCVHAQEIRPPPGEGNSPPPNGTRPPPDGSRPPPEGTRPPPEGTRVPGYSDDSGLDRPHFQCYSNISCSDCELKMGRCVEDKKLCCFEKPPPMPCRKNVTCEQCKQLGGDCDDGKCCFNKTEPPHEMCRPNVTCERCQGAGGVCKDGKCCFREPDDDKPHSECQANITCSDCQMKQGRCINDTKLCCFEKPPHDMCRPNVTCERCKETGGVCKDGKCCFRERDDGDDDDDDNDENDKGNGGKPNHDDDSDEDSDDDDDKHGNSGNDRIDGHYQDYNGQQVRCTKRKCNKQKQSCGPKGVCIDGKCCFQQTEKEAQSLCEKERNRLEEAAKVSPSSDAEHINCTSEGSFLAKCKVADNECHCLNASTGRPVGNSIRVASKNKINCDDIQKKTKAGRLNMKLTASNRPYNSYSEQELEDMQTQAKEQIESTAPVTVKEMEARSGSVVLEFELEPCESDCPATANTSDLYALASAVMTQIEDGDIVFNVNGEVTVASSPSITEITSVAALEDMEKEMPDYDMHHKDKTKQIIIIVIATVVVVAMVTVGTVCYFYSRARKNREKGNNFSNIMGKDNPVYTKA